MEITPSEIISHAEMVLAEGVSLQRGMNFNMPSGFPVILMSTRPGAPYKDRVENGGKTLVYEGHNVPRNLAESPDKVDQELNLPSGALTENGRFFKAAKDFASGLKDAVVVKVYEKLRPGVWVFNGYFRLVNAYEEITERRVYKFELELHGLRLSIVKPIKELSIGRMIPSHIKQEVFRRDQGKCVECGESNNLHFDHIVPHSKGGSSIVSANIQLLCARHNLSKSDKII